MLDFAEAFGDFLTELKNAVLMEIFESNPTYAKLKEKKEAQFAKLRSSVPPVLLDGYIETQYAIASFEINYCYLCGLRDKNRPEGTNPTGEEISQEFNKFEAYRHRQDQAREQHDELKAILQPDIFTLLTLYMETWSTILGIEKHYCYAGGLRDKAKLDEQLDFTTESAWESLCNLFL